MSTSSELYNDYSAESSRLSREELQALHEYNERLTRGEAQPDPCSSAQGPISSFGGSTPNKTSETVLNVATRYNPWNERDGQTTHPSQEVQEHNKYHWKDLHEQQSVAERANDPKTRAQGFNDGLCLDPYLKSTGTSAIQHYHDQILAMNAFLHLQEQEDQFQQELSTGNNLSEQVHVGQEQTPGTRSVSPGSRISIKSLLSFGDISNPSYTTEPVDQSTTFVSRPSTYLNTPRQYLQAKIPRDQELEDHSVFRASRQNVCFLPQPNDGYTHPTISFPPLTYVIDEASDLNHQHDDSDSKHNRLQSGSTTHYTRYSTLEPPPIRDNTMTTDPSIVTDRSKKLPPHPPKNIKKGTERKKPHVPTRRWSRTHLNQLMREHRPRNLPQSVNFTDHVDVQDVPIEKITPAYCVVGAENDSRIIQFGAGTRVDNAPIQARGDSTIPGSAAKLTPFRLVVRDQHGNITVDTRWDLNVAVHDPLETSSHINTRH